MFEVGEIVFCKLRGTGVVQAIEQRTLLGEEKECMVIQMHFPEIVIMIPLDRLENSGFRKISDIHELEKVETILSSKEVSCDYDIDIKKRIKDNQQKLATGSLIECSEVVRDLNHMEKVKPLNNMEKNLLMQATKLLVDEVAVLKKQSNEETKEDILSMMIC
ncbi:MAG: CarD family transcriptional regulator [Cellulosilyticaceae bacterium]